jgi:hypothetical protein
MKIRERNGFTLKKSLPSQRVSSTNLVGSLTAEYSVRPQPEQMLNTLDPDSFDGPPAKPFALNSEKVGASPDESEHFTIAGTVS